MCVQSIHIYLLLVSNAFSNKTAYPCGAFVAGSSTVKPLFYTLWK